MPSALLDPSRPSKPQPQLQQTSCDLRARSIQPCNGQRSSLPGNTGAGPARKPVGFGRARDLPILGRAQGGSDGNMTLNDTAIDWTFRPADLQGVRDAFAVFVTGDSMVPKYKNQDLAYVHPSKRPVKDRYVLVETADHSGFIKQFVRWEGDILVLRQYNPAQEIRLHRAEVRRVMLVIGSLDA